MANENSESNSEIQKTAAELRKIADDLRVTSAELQRQVELLKERIRRHEEEEK